jgi:citrate lyase subunit beta/citryl-CoA lyase
VPAVGGLVNAYEIASCCPRIIGMALSSADYCRDIKRDIKVVRTKGCMELDWARGMLQKEAMHAKALGFDAKTNGGYHDCAAATINKAFTPTAGQFAYAKKVLAMAGNDEAEGDAVAWDGDILLDLSVVARIELSKHGAVR